MNVKVRKTSKINEIKNNVVVKTVSRDVNSFRNVFLKKHSRASLLIIITNLLRFFKFRLILTL